MRIFGRRDKIAYRRANMKIKFYFEIFLLACFFIYVFHIVKPLKKFKKNVVRKFRFYFSRPEKRK